MADETAKLWPRVAAGATARLPDSWVLGGRGIRAVLVRQPVEWLLVWVGLDRVRRDDDPYLMGGIRPLLQPFSLGYRIGLRSDERLDAPARISMSAPDAEDQVEQFVTRGLMPLVDLWTTDKFAAEAEKQFAQPPEQRERPLAYPEAAGWRVLAGTGSPLEPARQAAQEYGSIGGADLAAWYETFAAAWESGGRPAALALLEEQRSAALTQLKLPRAG